MKYRLGSVTIEAIDTYVRITITNAGGIGTPDRVAVTKHECPPALEIAQLLADMRGYWPDRAHLWACGSAADDARKNKTASELCL